MTGPEHVEVWQQADGTWRWRWVGEDRPGGPSVLPSNNAEATMSEAAEAARTAYPHLTVHLPPATVSSKPLRPSRVRRLWPLALAVALLIVRHRLRGRRSHHP